ncbi:hypothetical protein GYH30_004200 [Glycine max]|nr:hypothetical protein GYH30_004200 [Glycine max]
MTRGDPSDLQPFDPEIDRTFHRLVRHHFIPFDHSEHSIIGESVHSVIGDFEHPDLEHYNFEHSDSEHSDFAHSENMAQPPPRERTLREMAAPDFTYESLCIQYPDENVPYVLKTGLIHLLPKFHGLAGEDPHKHLKKFHIVCSTMKPPDVQEDHIFLKAFPHSLEGVAKDWLYYLAPRSITSWDDLKRVFLEKIFPVSRTTAIRKDISGLSNMERSMIDAASGGALGDMTPAEARNLIEKMASNSQQFSARNDAIVIRGVHEVATNPSASSETKKLEGKLDALVNLVTQLALNHKSVPVARVCGLCSSADHHTDLCPSMQQPGAIEQPEAYAANIYNRPPQPQQQNQPQQNNYDLSSNRYNPGWRNHPNLRWSSPQQQQQQPAPSFQNVASPSRPYIPPPIQQQQQPQK